MISTHLLKLIFKKQFKKISKMSSFNKTEIFPFIETHIIEIFETGDLNDTNRFILYRNAYNAALHNGDELYAMVIRLIKHHYSTKSVTDEQFIERMLILKGCLMYMDKTYCEYGRNKRKKNIDNIIYCLFNENHYHVAQGETREYCF